MEVDLVISGGSVEGICTATGFLRAIVDDLGHKVAAAAGNSAGAVVLSCHAAGKTPREIEEAVLNTDFGSFVRVPAWWEFWGWKAFLRRGWLSDGEDFLKLLERMTDGKKMKDAAFDLHVVGSDFTHYKLGVFNRESDPEMRLALAARISACLPGAFKPVRYGDAVWYDGGVRRHYPVDKVPESDRPFYGWLVGSLEYGSVPVETRPGILGTLMDYVEQAVDANVQAGLRLSCRQPITVSYDDPYVGTMDFDIDFEEKKRLIELARQKTVETLGTPTLPQPGVA